MTTFIDEKNPYLTPLNLEKKLPSGESTEYLSQDDVAYQDYLKKKMLESATTFAELARLKALEKTYKEPTRQEMMTDILNPSQPARQTAEGVYTNIPETKPASVPVERPLGTSPEYQPQPTTQPTQTGESVSDKIRKANRLYMKPEQVSLDIQRQESENSRKQRFMSSPSYLKYVSQIRPIIEKYGGRYDPRLYFGDNYNATIQALDPENKSKFMNEVSTLATKDTKESPLIQDINFLAKEFNVSPKEAYRLKKTFGEKSREAFMMDVYNNSLSSNDAKRQEAATKAGEFYDSVHKGKEQTQTPTPQQQTQTGDIMTNKFLFKKYERESKGKYDPKIFTKGKGIYRVDGKIVQWDGQNATER